SWSGWGGRWSMPTRSSRERRYRRRARGPAGLSQPLAVVSTRPLDQGGRALEEDFTALDVLGPDQGRPSGPVAPQRAAWREPPPLGQPESVTERRDGPQRAEDVDLLDPRAGEAGGPELTSVSVIGDGLVPVAG